MKTFGCQRHLRELKGKCHGLNCVPCPNSDAGVLTPRTAERALQGSGPSRRCHRETGLAEGAPSPLHRPHRRELQTQRRTCEEGAGVGHAGAWGRPALPHPGLGLPASSLGGNSLLWCQPVPLWRFVTVAAGAGAANCSGPACSVSANHTRQTTCAQDGTGLQP